MFCIKPFLVFHCFHKQNFRNVFKIPRYERIPNNFTTVIFPDGTQPPHSTLSFPSPTTGSLFTTLSRYLYHKRWIWSATHSTNPKLPDQSISRILNTLTR